MGYSFAGNSYVQFSVRAEFSMLVAGALTMHADKVLEELAI